MPLFITALVFAGLGLALLGFGIYFVNQASASASWPSVEGRVQRVAIRTSHAGTSGAKNVYTYYASVMYRYMAEDQPYISQRFSLGNGDRMGKRHNTREAARAAAPYKAGDAIQVYYDPAQPAEAVLQTGANWGTYVPVILGLLFTGFGAWLFIVGRG